ncbi:Dihydroorotase [Magnetospirillum sp. LM-5]|uniref:dihydroorotase n=1 Tax=Magnetospirillum sp. LM-5 TaxID=2681466 RepID=UPI00137F40EF|nr:dihydroorotase [Magnetospirillum sp. LM-5]CAA7624069.1 Dihydroorotase [Magnetospirillum sp. LM-5]
MSKPAPAGLVAYVNARLLDPASGLDRPGALLTNGETIADVGPGLFQGGVPSGIEVVDCSGHCLAPGLIDMRVQLREPGEEHKETLRSAGEAAVAGGVTAMVCLPNTDPVIDEVATVEFVARRARKIGLAKVYPYAAATKGLEGKELAEMGFLMEAGALAFTDGVKAIGDSQTMRRALSYAATFGALIVQHPEDPSLASGGAMNAGELATRMGLSGIPAAAEAIMLERDMRLVAMTGGRYHAAHVSTADGVAIIRKAKQAGLPVTCDTAPPYFALNELAVKDYRTFAKLSPPLRAEEDRRAVVDGLKDGTIDAIASDHAPQDADSKRQPFAQAEFGGVGLETLLPITLELVHDGHLGLLDALRRVTSGPADILGLAGGRLKVGAAADLVLFDPARGWKIEPDRFRSKSKNSPFDARPVQGLVLRTIVDGRTVFRRDV